jgi:serine protease Do
MTAGKMVAAALAVLAFTSAPQALVAPAFAQAQQLPSVADLADRLLPAVVEISIESKVPTTALPTLPELPENSPFKDFFDDFLKKRQGQGEQPEDRTVNSMGSGFVIDAAGLIVTNNHVVEGAETMTVHFQDGSELKAELVGRDAKTDLAVIRVKPDKPLPAVSFGDSDKLRIGEWVMAIGNPFGLGGSVSLGIVSARNRDINAGPYDDFIQTDAAINKGNSGGPLFNLAGDVVGINTAIFSPTGGSVGIGFSVPANTAKGVVDQLVKYGETRRGWFGVKIQTVTDDLAESMGMDKPRGALIADVTDPGPAKAAGIEPGDVIIEFNGKPVSQMRDLPRIVADTEIGKKVMVKVLRGGKEMEFSAEVGRLEDGEKVVAAQAQSGSEAVSEVVSTLGLTAQTMTDELRQKYSIDEKVTGLVVTEIANDGPAAENRMAPGDVITEAGEMKLSRATDLTDAVEAARKAKKEFVLVLVSKGGKTQDMRFIALKLQ